jgi:hypothetical protein
MFHYVYIYMYILCILLCLYMYIYIHIYTHTHNIYIYIYILHIDMVNIYIYIFYIFLIYSSAVGHVCWGGSSVQVVQHLSSKHEALGSNPCAVKMKKKKTTCYQNLANLNNAVKHMWHKCLCNLLAYIPSSIYPGVVSLIHIRGLIWFLDKPLHCFP